MLSSAKGAQGYLEPAEINKILAEEKASPTAVLLDPEGKVGKSFNAKVTPHMYIINPEGQLVYQGAIDSKNTASKDDIKTSSNYVRLAFNALASGGSISPASTEAYGCGIKYKK